MLRYFVISIMALLLMVSCGTVSQPPPLEEQFVEPTRSEAEEQSNESYTLVSSDEKVTGYQTDQETVFVSDVPLHTEEVPLESPHITFAVGGDVLFKYNVASAYKVGGCEGVMNKPLADLFWEADIAMINLETPISTRGEPDEAKDVTFCSDPVHMPFLSEYMGIDIVSMANNHVLDYGYDAFFDTFDYLDEYGIYYTGAGRDLNEAKAYKIIESQNRKIAVLAACRHMPFMSWYATADRAGLFATYDPSMMIEQIKEAKTEADFVVIYIHWGVEGSAEVQDYQRILAKMYIDAGADAVIGSHPHVLQGFEIYKGKPIAYSLGDFIWPRSERDTCAIVLNITDEDIWMEVKPCVIINGRTVLLEEPNEVGVAYDYLQSISFDITISADGRIYA